MNQREKNKVIKQIESLNQQLKDISNKILEIRSSMIGEDSFLESSISKLLIKPDFSAPQDFMPIACLTRFIYEIDPTITSNKLSRILSAKGFERSQKKIGGKLYKGFYAKTYSNVDHIYLMKIYTNICL
ncbi:hypothetical protein Phi17:1_gp31 [Cellulophaga phage phi17:1]|uniref:Uncharacterized protein n=1 Tax=Cellulophaga phage phi17:1 TaxID=1327980 RepID=S0A1F0_9CAUD|nr:hypothetical protein Phi17:1_gp31 [Cellulophaga phage phi17:1]AGO48307.1 hypothetical protein Phi17:1_gp31 [Cellulophaga phage phi17:1]